MNTFLEMDSIKFLDVGFTEKSGRSTNTSFLRHLEGEGRVGEDVLIEKRRGFKEDDVVGRDLRK